MAYRTIVVGTDGSATTAVAQAAAFRIARVFKAEVVLVTAYEPPRMNRLMAGSVLEQSVDAAAQAKVQSVSTELRQGEAAEFVIDVAKERLADLIVVGNKGMGQATRFKLGSVPDRVAHFAPCDLLIVDTTRSDRTKRAHATDPRTSPSTDTISEI